MIAKPERFYLLITAILSSVLLLARPLAVLAASGPLCFVDAGASGGNSGDSWTDAYTDLQSALTDANCTEIWVAAGIYTPTTNPSDQTATFHLVDGVGVYGGFAGTETARDQRDLDANLTILSGDIDGNDSQSPVITGLEHFGHLTVRPI